MFDVHFDEPAAALAFLAALHDLQIPADVSIDTFAGEDDLDDTARIVHVRGNLREITTLIDAHQGWVIDGKSGVDIRVGEVPELPQGPRRFKH